MYSEEHLARRIAHERERHGWTFEGLAKRLTDAGCPIASNAVYRMEKGEPRRRITVDELVALSKVFGLDITNLLLPPEVVGVGLGVELFDEWARSREAIATAQAVVQAAQDEHRAVEDKIRTHLGRYPEATEAVLNALSQWAHEAGWRDAWIRQTSQDLRGVPQDDPERREEQLRTMLEFEEEVGYEVLQDEFRAEALADRERRDHARD